MLFLLACPMTYSWFCYIHGACLEESPRSNPQLQFNRPRTVGFCLTDHDYPGLVYFCNCSPPSNKLEWSREWYKSMRFCWVVLNFFDPLCLKWIFLSIWFVFKKIKIKLIPSSTSLKKIKIVSQRVFLMTYFGGMKNCNKLVNWGEMQNLWVQFAIMYKEE